MLITPAFVYAKPNGHYDVVRDNIETLILQGTLNADDADIAVLQSLQAGFNQAIKRERLDIAPLSLRIPRGTFS